MKPRLTITRKVALLKAWWIGYQLHRTARVDPRALIQPERRHDIRIGEKTKIHPFALLASHGGHICLGASCSVNSFAVLYGHGGLTIGNNVRIAAHSVLVPANHNFINRDIPIREQGLEKKGIVVEDDVWIGAHSVILDGVTVAHGCVVAAGAVIAKSTEPNGVYAGVPAKRIKDRGHAKQ